MKLHLHLCLLAIAILFGTAACRNTATSNEGAMAVATTSSDEDVAAQPTTIYLVRHAEKDISNPSEQDPDLTAEGAARAEALRARLEGQKIDVLFSTKYKRTQNTLKPMAEARNLEVQLYEAHDFIGISSQIKEQHQGKTIVIAGHSNTILPLVEALGAKRPIPDITDSQYDYLFKVTLDPKGEAAVETAKYGAMAK